MPATISMPTWLKTILLAVGLVIGAAFLVELALVIGRRCRQAVTRAAQLHTVCSGQGPGSGRLAEDAKDRARIILADYDRLIVTCNKVDDTVYVLRPPGADPKAVLGAACLVLSQDPYEELAGHLGVPVNWPLE